MGDVYRPDRVHWYRTQATNSQIGDLLRHEDELIAEVNRLRPENAALREIAQAITKKSETDYRKGLEIIVRYNENYDEYECIFCWGTFQQELDGTKSFAHEADCVVTKARALLGEEQRS